ncbi:MAG TPA: ATP-binding protein, partial [Caulobacteraceae bacterium]|nr:ATP-binding protein [Caulobacteraceae bacterium]
MNVSDVKSLADAMRREIARAVVGQADTVDLMLTAMMAGGHVLLEGPPGTAKTFLAQCFAHTL